LLTKAEHLRKATDNEALVSQQDLTHGICVDWSVTFLFYSAVHYVGAYFAVRGLAHRMHKTRNSAIGRDRVLREVYNDYRELQDFSRDARYERPTGLMLATSLTFRVV
jgi:hypothetical protein